MRFLSFGNNINLLALRLDYCGDLITDKVKTVEYFKLSMVENFINCEKYSCEK